MVGDLEVAIDAYSLADTWSFRVTIEMPSSHVDGGIFVVASTSNLIFKRKSVL